MELSDMLNISKVNVEEKIKEAIIKVKNELYGLDTNGTCQIYSSHIQNELQANHVLSFLINTKDIGLDYKHYFVLVKDGEDNYIVDLTYEQFGYQEPKVLLQEGYMKVSELELRGYLRQLSKITCRHNRKGL